MVTALDSRRIYKYKKYDSESSRWACINVTLHCTLYVISNEVHVCEYIHDEIQYNE